MFFFLCLLAQGVYAVPLLGNLQVEGLVTPLALPTTSPHFSWVTGGVQLSYQIILTQVYPTQALLWDTGVVASNASTFIPYTGTTGLSEDGDFHWTLNVQQAGVGLSSADSIFSTAPPTPLPGSWLGFADTVRGALELSAEPVMRARLHTTGVGCYVAYVNGQRVSPDLAPGFGHAPSARALYNTYDVSRHLVPGENVVGLRIGSCKWGAFGQYCTGTPAQCNAGWAFLSVTQGEGNTTTLSTSGGGGGGGWLGANTSILYQHLWNGELYDARLEPTGWNAPGYNGTDGAPWVPATAVSYPDMIGPLAPAPGPPLVPRALDPLTPVTVTMPSGGDAGHGGPFVFDLGPGMNLAGLCGMDLSPPPGEQPVAGGVSISLLHAEVLQLNGNGSVWNHYLPPGGTHQPNGLNQPQMNYTYVTRGGGREEEAGVGPHHSFFGFRYVEMRGWPYTTPPTPSRLTCHFLHTTLPPSGALSFPLAPGLNDLQTSTLRTHLSNYVSLPTDCPQREKRGWTGDAQLTVHSGMLNFESLAFYKAWHASILDQQIIGCLPAGEAPGRAGGVGPIRPPNWACDPPSTLKNITLAQYQYGPVSDVVPREQLGMGYFIGDPSWEVAATTIPYELLTSLGDLGHIAATYTQGPFSMMKWLNALGEDDATADGLITWSYLGDWVAIDTPSRYLVANINYLMAATQTAEMAGALGKSGDAVTFLALASLLSQSARAKWWNASAAHWDAGSQSAQALALGFGVGGEDLVGPASTALLAALGATGGHLTVGASGAQVLLRVLHTINPATALALALQPSYPSWAAFLTPNSSFSPVPLPGTMWEAWDLASAEHGSSFNHIFKAGGISPYLYEGALGLAFAMRPQAVLHHQPGATDPTTTPPCPPCKGTTLAAAAQTMMMVVGGEGGLLPSRFGLSCPHIQVLCDVLGDGTRETALGSLAAKVSKAFSKAGLPLDDGTTPNTRALVPKLGLTVTAAAALSLGRASGWRVTPAGNVSFAWGVVKADGGVLTLRAQFSVPSGVDGRLELPLGVFGGGGGGGGGGGSKGDGGVGKPIAVSVTPVGHQEGVLSMVVNGPMVVISGGGADAAGTWAPTVQTCGGGAAAHVEGRGQGKLGRGCSSVLLMTLPPGEHVVVMQG